MQHEINREQPQFLRSKSCALLDTWKILFLLDLSAISLGFALKGMFEVRVDRVNGDLEVTIET